MANRNDGVRAFAASASSVLLEHDYSGYFRNNNDNDKNINDNKENVFETNNKFHGTFDAVDKWADSVIMRVPIGHDRRKIVDREITIHKVKYPFLPEQQIRGKVYRKFGIPTVMGGVLSRVVASFSGSSAKDRPKRRRRDPKKSKDRRRVAATSQDSRTAGLAGSHLKAEDRSPGGSHDHPHRLPTVERLTFAEEAPVRQEMSPPTVSSCASEESNDGSLLVSEESRSPSREQKSPDLDSSGTQEQLISSLDLDRLSLNDEIEPTLFRKSKISAQRRCHESIHSQLTQILDREAERVWTSEEATVVLDRVSTNGVSSATSLESFETAVDASLGDLPTQISASASGTDVVRTSTKTNYPRNSAFGGRENFHPMSGNNILDASEFLLLERVRSAGETFVRKFDRTSSSWEEGTKDQRKMKKSSSDRLVDHLDLGVKKKQLEDFVSRCSSHKKPEVLHSGGSITHEQPEEIVSRCSWSHKKPEVLHSQGSMAHEQPEEFVSRCSSHKQPEILHSRSSTAHEQPEEFVSRCSSRKQPEIFHSRGSMTHEQPEEFVSRCSSHKQPEVLYYRSSSAHKQPEVFSRCSSRKQPEVLYSRSPTAHEQPEVLDSRVSATGEQPGVCDSLSSSRGVVNFDHSYSGRRECTGSEKRRERKRGRIETSVNFPRKIRIFGSLKSAGSKIRLTGKVPSSEDKENSTCVSHCGEVENETKILDEYSLQDDIIILPTVGASPLSIVKPKQRQAGRPIATDVSASSRNAMGNVKVATFIGEPEVDADSPKNLNGSLIDSSPGSFVPWWTDTHLLPVDLLSNHCSEYDQPLTIEAKLRGRANEFPSCEKNILKTNIRVSSSEIAKNVKKILEFLDNDCVDV